MVFLALWIFFLNPSFMDSAKLNQNKQKEKSDSLKYIYYFIPSLDRNFHQETKIEHSVQPLPVDLRCRHYTNRNDVQ